MSVGPRGRREMRRLTCAFCDEDEDDVAVLAAGCENTTRCETPSGAESAT